MAVQLMPKSHLSHSQIERYMRCPADYYFRYVEQVETPSTPAMYRGTIVHKGTEYNYQQKVETHEDLPVKEVLEYTADKFESASDGTEWTEEKGKVKDETLSLLGLYQKEVAPTIQPVLVEERMEIEFDGVDYSLLAYIDIVDDKGWIHDTKTKGRTPASNTLDTALQPLAYALVYETMYGKLAGFAMDCLVSLKTPKVVTLTKEVTTQETQRFLKIMDAVAKNIEAGNYYPNPTSMFCSKKCSYWSECQKEW